MKLLSRAVIRAYPRSESGLGTASPSGHAIKDKGVLESKDGSPVIIEFSKAYTGKSEDTL